VTVGPVAPDGRGRRGIGIGAGLTGAGLYVLLYAWVALCQRSHYAHPAGLDVGLVGVVPREAVGALLRAVWPVVLATNLVLLAFHAAAGFTLGLLAGRAADDLGWLLRRPASSGARSIAAGGLLLAIAALAFATVIARYPFQYDRLLHRRGGAARHLQTMVTRYADPDALQLVLWSSIAVLGLPVLLRAVLRHPAAVAVGGGLLVVGAAAGDRSATPAGRNAGPNVVLILLESARPDYLSVNGYPRPTSPALEQLVADRGVTFTDAWAHTNGTVASVVTIMTSVYAHQHGIRSMFHGEEFATRRPTLPALLRAHGFATRVVADWDGDVTYFNERVLPGFDQYDVAEFGVINYVKQIYAQHGLFYALTDNVVGHRVFATFYRAGGGYAPAGGDQYYRDRIARHLGELARTPRFFLTLFFADAHLTYRCPYPYYTYFTDPAYAGPSKYQAVANRYAPSGRPAEAAQIAGLYAGCLRAQDDDIGFVVRTLRRLGLDRQTILVVTGDHGERLPDAASFRYGRHGAWLDPAQFRVPLVIAAPHVPRAARSVSATARHVDLMPTILDLAGVAAPAGLRGESLVPLLMTGRRGARAVDVLGETGFHWTPVSRPFLGYPSIADVVALRVDARGALVPRYFLRPDCVPRIDLAKHRFIRTATHQLNYRPLTEGARTELYDLAADPDLRHDVSARVPALAAELRARLFAWAVENPLLTVRDGVLSTRDPRDRERCAPGSPGPATADSGTTGPRIRGGGPAGAVEGRPHPRSVRAAPAIASASRP
jgi:arylsulfatase A-like enzyme